MKVFILSNCSSRAYLNYLKACYPDWDIRSAVMPQAASWVKEGHEAFLSFLAELDVFVGLTDREPVRSHISKNATIVDLPSFDFFGLQPDCVWLQGITSPTDMGVIHSRIGASAWATGKSVSEAASLFNAAHYADLGYFEKYQADQPRVLERFKTANIDLQEPLQEWLGWGDFLYTPNHPDTRVFFDIAHLGMKAAGLEPTVSQADVTACRDTFEDYLKAGILWPLYSEIADHHSITVERPQWRSSSAKGDGHSFDLTEMLERSWRAYEEVEGARDIISKALGGQDRVAQYART